MPDSRLLNISDFLSRVSGTGFARANRVTVEIFLPTKLIESIPSAQVISRTLTYSAEQVTLPGRILQASDISIYGPPIKMPTRTLYNDLNITFLCNDFMTQRSFFDLWINYINPSEQGYNLRYRDDYVGRINIYQMNEKGDKPSYGITLYEVYPLIVNDMGGNWVDTEIQRLQVQFSYRYWENIPTVLLGV